MVKSASEASKSAGNTSSSFQMSYDMFEQNQDAIEGFNQVTRDISKDMILEGEYVHSEQQKPEGDESKSIKDVFKDKEFIEGTNEVLMEYSEDPTAVIDQPHESSVRRSSRASKPVLPVQEAREKLKRKPRKVTKSTTPTKVSQIKKQQTKIKTKPLPKVTESSESDSSDETAEKEAEHNKKLNELELMETIPKRNVGVESRLGEKKTSNEGNTVIIKKVNEAISQRISREEKEMTEEEKMLSEARKSMEENFRAAAIKNKRTLTKNHIDVLISYAIESNNEDVDSAMTYLDGYIRGSEESRIRQLTEMNEIFKKLSNHSHSFASNIETQRKVVTDLLGLSTQISEISGSSKQVIPFVKSAQKKIPAAINRKRRITETKSLRETMKSAKLEKDRRISEEKEFEYVEVMKSEDSDGEENESDDAIGSYEEVGDDDNKEEQKSGSVMEVSDNEDEATQEENSEEEKRRIKGKSIMIEQRKERKKDVMSGNSEKLMAQSFKAALQIGSKSQKKVVKEIKTSKAYEEWEFKDFIEAMGATEGQVCKVLELLALDDSEKINCVKVFRKFVKREWLNACVAKLDKLAFRSAVLGKLREAKDHVVVQRKKMKKK